MTRLDAEVFAAEARVELSAAEQHSKHAAAAKELALWVTAMNEQLLAKVCSSTHPSSCRHAHAPVRPIFSMLYVGDNLEVQDAEERWGASIKQALQCQQ